MARSRATNSAEGDWGLPPLGKSAGDEGLSLDKLNQAFASMLGEGDDPYAPPPEPEPAEDAPVGSVEEPTVDDDAHCPLTPRSILESMLFVGHPQNEPLTSARVAQLMRGVRVHEVDELVAELNDLYRREGRPYLIVSEGEGFRLTLRGEFAGLREQFYGRIRQARLSTAAIEVLSLVAYNGPLEAEQVNRLRGTPSGALLSQLVRRQLLAIERLDVEPKTVLYHVTPRFLELFGIKSLEELPRSQDVEQR